MTDLKIQLNDGNLMPIIGLGTGGLEIDSIRDAIDCGYRHFDSAFVNKNEKLVGDAINEAINDGRVKREDIFFTSKVWPTYYSEGRVIKSAKQSIQESGLKYLDLLLLHWPIVLVDNDTETYHLREYDNIFSDYNLVDVYKELEEVKRMALAKSIGVANFNSQQIERIVKNAQIIPTINHVECHPYLNQEKLINFCRQYDITMTAYLPLERGKYPNKPSLFQELTLQKIAKKHSKSIAQIVIRWQIQRGLVVIPRSWTYRVSATQQLLQENIVAFDFTLTNDDITAINALTRNFRYVDLNRSKTHLDRHKEYPFNIEF